MLYCNKLKEAEMFEILLYAWTTMLHNYNGLSLRLSKRLQFYRNNQVLAFLHYGCNFQILSKNMKPNMIKSLK